MSKVELLRELIGDDIDMKRIAKTISTDVSLTYRLLKYINSSFFGFAQKVDSVLRAVGLMGAVSTKQWLMAVLMADMGDSHKAKELGRLSIERAKFLELVVGAAPDVELGPESMFLLGLFSKLDALLGQEMSAVLDHVSLNEELKRALLGERTPLHEWLELVEALEWDSWSAAEPIFARRGLSLEQAAALRRKAQEWAQNLSAASS
jgi:EAL and modified HD-GYP domain-containing signal transduction protein